MERTPKSKQRIRAMNENTIIIIESPNKVNKIEQITGAKVYATNRG